MFEGLFHRGLHGLVTDGLRQQLREAGVDLARPLHPAYTLATWEQALEIAAKVIHPELPLETGLTKLGEAMVTGYVGTLIGGGLFGLLRVIGPRRAIHRLKSSFRSGNNYSEATIDELGPADFRIRLNETGHTQFLSAGILRVGMNLTGAKDTRVRIESRDAEGVTYRVSWSPAGKAERARQAPADPAP